MVQRRLKSIRVCMLAFVCDCLRGRSWRCLCRLAGANRPRKPRAPKEKARDQGPARQSARLKTMKTTILHEGSSEDDEDDPLLPRQCEASASSADATASRGEHAHAHVAGQKRPSSTLRTPSPSVSYSSSQ